MARRPSASGPPSCSPLGPYPQPVRAWIRQRGCFTSEMKHGGNGPYLWAMVDPCLDEF